MGSNNRWIEGDGITLIGNRNTCSLTNSTVFGDENTCNLVNSTCKGNKNKIAGERVISFGKENSLSLKLSVVVGSDSSGIVEQSLVDIGSKEWVSGEDIGYFQYIEGVDLVSMRDNLQQGALACARKKKKRRRVCDVCIVSEDMKDKKCENTGEGCVICLENKAILKADCEHILFCYKCHKDFLTSGYSENGCPLCRKQINMISDLDAIIED